MDKRLTILKHLLKEKNKNIDIEITRGYLQNYYTINIRLDNFIYERSFSPDLLLDNLECTAEILYHEFIQACFREQDNSISKIAKNSLYGKINNHDEVYAYKRFILTTRDFKKGKELLNDAVCHRVITQKEYDYLTGYTDALRDGGKQNV